MRAQWSRAQAERRQGANDIEKATNGSSGEAVKKKMAKLETTSTGGTRRRRKRRRTTAVEIVAQAAAVVAAAMAMRAVQEGNGDRRARLDRVALALRGSGQLGPNGLSGAGHKRRRHGTNDIGKATNGSSGEAGKTKMAKLDTTCAGDTTARRKVKEDNSSENGGTGSSSDGSTAMAMRAVQDTGQGDWRWWEAGGGSGLV
jgi:hypothetical protein